MTPDKNKELRALIADVSLVWALLVERRDSRIVGSVVERRRRWDEAVTPDVVSELLDDSDKLVKVLEGLSNVQSSVEKAVSESEALRDGLVKAAAQSIGQGLELAAATAKIMRLEAERDELAAEMTAVRFTAAYLASRVQHDRVERVRFAYKTPTPPAPYDYACSQCCVPPYAIDSVVPDFVCSLHEALPWAAALESAS